MKKTGIEGPVFRTDRAAEAALRRAVARHRYIDGYVIVRRHVRSRSAHVTVALKFHYAEDAQGSGTTLRAAAHRALCSAGYR